MNIKKKNKNIRMSKYSNEQLLMMDILDVYKLVLSGEVRRFPPGTWERPEAIENSLECAKYLIEEILKWDLEDVKRKIRMSVFVKHKLGGMMQTLYGNSPYEILSKLYPNKFMPWELHEAPKSTWHDKNNRILAMDWLINKRLKWTREDIIEKYNNQVLVENDLGGLLSECGFGSSFSLLDEFMPGEFYCWELKASSPPINFWKERSNRVFAIKHMIEDILKWDKEDIKKNLTQEVFKKYNLYGLLMNYYNGSPYKVLQEAYPNEFLPWELLTAPSGFWDVKENRVSAIRWLFDEKLKWSIDKIKKNVSQKVFIDNRLISILGKGTLYSLLSEAYPDQIQEWELPFTSSVFWEKKTNRMKALEYLFKEKLQWSIDDIKKNISQQLFMENNLAGLLKYYKGSPYNVVTEYLPNEDIKAWELSVTPNGFWQDDKNCVEATQWLIKKLNIDLNNIDMITKSILAKYKVQGIIYYKYNGSITELKKDLVRYLEK